MADDKGKAKSAEAEARRDERVARDPDLRGVNRQEARRD